MNYSFVTDGEHLAYFLDQNVLHQTPWARLSESLAVTGRGPALIRLFRELTVINLTCRIVRAGTSLLRAAADRPVREIEDAAFIEDYRVFLRERLLIPHERVAAVLRRALLAVRAVREQISDTQRRRLKRQAFRTHQHCYMCGVMLDFDEEHPHHRFELEHIWPQSYGGNSIDDNLLPVCGACNRRKSDYVTWAMPPVQSLILGFSPSEDERNAVHGVYRFALHYFAARRLLALNPQRTLKWAFQRLRPFAGIRVRDPGDIGDFFNLDIHEPHPQLASEVDYATL